MKWHFVERHELIDYYQSEHNANHSGELRLGAFMRLRVNIAISHYKRIKLGSKKWHKVQDKLSFKPSVGKWAIYRVAFYYATMSCGDFFYTHPLISIHFPENVKIGTNVFFNRNVFITARDTVSIGNNVLIGPNVVINSGNHNYKNKAQPISQQGHSVAPIVIEDDVWIGANCAILKGVHIGKGAVIGAGCIVTKDVAPYSVVVGNPLKVIGYREENT